MWSTLLKKKKKHFTEIMMHWQVEGIRPIVYLNFMFTGLEAFLDLDHVKTEHNELWNF